LPPPEKTSLARRKRKKKKRERGGTVPLSVRRTRGVQEKEKRGDAVICCIKSRPKGEEAGFRYSPGKKEGNPRL